VLAAPGDLRRRSSASSLPHPHKAAQSFPKALEGCASTHDRTVNQGQSIGAGLFVPVGRDPEAIRLNPAGLRIINTPQHDRVRSVQRGG